MPGSDCPVSWALGTRSLRRRYLLAFVSRKTYGFSNHTLSPRSLSRFSGVSRFSSGCVLQFVASSSILGKSKRLLFHGQNVYKDSGCYPPDIGQQRSFYRARRNPLHGTGCHFRKFNRSGCIHSCDKKAGLGTRRAGCQVFNERVRHTNVNSPAYSLTDRTHCLPPTN